MRNNSFKKSLAILDGLLNMGALLVTLLNKNGSRNQKISIYSEEPGFSYKII